MSDIGMLRQLSDHFEGNSLRGLRPALGDYLSLPLRAPLGKASNSVQFGKGR